MVSAQNSAIFFSSAMREEIQIFDATTIESLHWPETSEGEYAKRFLIPLIKKGIHYYVDNIQADIFALQTGALVLPILVTQENYENSFVCSPYGQYISYAKESIGLIENRFLAQLIKRLISGLGEIIRKGKINSVVYVNHWLFSTELYPSNLSSNQIELILQFLKKRFPEHAIIFRSLNPITTNSLLTSLKNCGFQTLVSRQVYITDATKESIFQTRILKSDLKLHRETSYKILDEADISRDDFFQLLRLYNLLYLTQHSYLNPQFNHCFIQMIFDQKLLRFKVIKIEGVIKGMAGYFERDGVMLCPIFGFDKQEPEHAVIYRLLCTSLLLEARKKGLIFHQSSGASFYKTIRRAENCMDYMAVYTGHLSQSQKSAWTLLRGFINTFAPRFMKKY